MKTFIVALLTVVSLSLGTFAGQFSVSVEGKGPSIDEKEITSVMVERSEGFSVLTLKLSAAGAARLADMTAAGVGKHLSIKLAGKNVSEPMIKSKIAGGELTIVDLSAKNAAAVVRAFLDRKN